MENLKIDNSPAKKLVFESVDKENIKPDAPIVDDLDFDLKKPQLEVTSKEEKPVVAPGIKPEEADEPLLQENPQRFVLFPIKYHEVGGYHASRVKWFRLVC